MSYLGHAISITLDMIRAEVDPRTHACAVCMRSLANQRGLDPSTVRRHIYELQDSGVLVVESGDDRDLVCRLRE